MNAKPFSMDRCTKEPFLSLSLSSHVSLHSCLAQDRFFPKLTAALIVANCLIFAWAWPAQVRQTHVVSSGEIQKSARQLVQVLVAPKSGLDPEEKRVFQAEADLQPFPSARLIAHFKRINDTYGSLSSEGRYRCDIVYPVFQALERSYAENPDQMTPFERFGFHGDDPWSSGMLSHQFLHAGFLHLLFNMIFLWAIACVLEGSLGWNLVWLYLSGGVAAATAQGLWGVPEGEIMVGASGSISALMGYGLFFRPNAKVKLFYIVLLFISARFGAFDAPLWFFLPIWLFEQVVMILMTAKSAVVTVGYAAHLGGFLAGAIFGIAGRFFSTAD